MRVLAACLAWAALACALVAGAARADEPDVQTGFLDRQVVVDGVAYRYQVFVPED